MYLLANNTDRLSRWAPFTRIILIAGSLIFLALFAVTVEPWHWRDPFPRIIGFILWIISPMVLMSVIIVAALKVSRASATAVVLLVLSLLVVGFGTLYYAIALFLRENEEANLAFIFGPIYQNIGILLLGGSWLVIAAVNNFWRSRQI